MLSLEQANRAVHLQTFMDTKHANIFALALPHPDTNLDTEAIRAFEKYAQEYEMAEALDFLHDAISPTNLVLALSGENRMEWRLCGF